MKIPRSILIGLLLAMTGATLSAGAYANTHPLAQFRRHSETVKYGDLNLSTKAGVAVLFQRIRQAGHQVCGPVYAIDPENTAQAWQDWQSCYTRALHNAARKVGNQQLSQMIDDRVPTESSAFASRG